MSQRRRQRQRGNDDLLTSKPVVAHGDVHVGEIEEEVKEKSLKIGKQETYTMNMICDNCDRKNKIEIPKGKRVADGVCPYCGCKELMV